jgi:hypothetical protein
MRPLFAALIALTALAGVAHADPGARPERFTQERFASDSFAQDRAAPQRFASDRFGGEGYDRRWDFNRRLQWIDARIMRGFERGQLDRREARFLNRELRNAARLHAAYARDGLSPIEARDLDDRLDRLSQRVRFERNDRDARFDDRRPVDYRDHRRGW